jgi:hypothetical protein
MLHAVVPCPPIFDRERSKKAVYGEALGDLAIDLPDLGT